MRSLEVDVESPRHSEIDVNYLREWADPEELKELISRLPNIPGLKRLQ